MLRSDMDKLNVGDKIEVRRYNIVNEDYEWIPTIVTNIYVCTDGGRFAHGGYHSVYANINGFTECLDPHNTRLAME